MITMKMNSSNTLVSLTNSYVVMFCSFTFIILYHIVSYDKFGDFPLSFKCPSFHYFKGLKNEWGSTSLRDLSEYYFKVTQHKGQQQVSFLYFNLFCYVFMISDSFCEINVLQILLWANFGSSIRIKLIAGFF